MPPRLDLRLCLLVMLGGCLVLPAADAARGQEPSAPGAAERPAETAAGADRLDPRHAEKMARGLALFTGRVRPLFAQHCLKCHGQDPEGLEGELDLATREGLLRGGASGPAAVLGRGADSLLYQVVAHRREPHMPYEAEQLSAELIAPLAAWIDCGAPYDGPLVERAGDAEKWTQKSIDPAARAFWSFRPLEPVAVPAVSDAAWCRTLIDVFIRAAQEAAAIEPNPPSDPRRLIRRLYFDLLGLPPAPDEVEAFAADPSPAAYERLVDRLLESPRYGERWGRHWLDLARFGESHGFEHDYDRPSAYHYRDFVIRALNDDLPYDEFVKWQIAGDEYAPDDNLALTATGFLAAGVHSTQITKNEVEKHRYDELDDVVATIGTALLGLTIGCARCHDHKYDPLPSADYYRMVAVFTTAVRSEIDLNLDPQGFARQRAAFEQAHAPFVAAREAFERELLPARFAAWEASLGEAGFRPVWRVLEPLEFSSQHGATLVKLPDDSLLVSGENPKFDAYSLTFRTTADRTTAIRLEALAHPSLPKGGPGRGQNGNFALTRLKVQAATRDAPRDAAREVPLAGARATFEQQDFPVSAAIDADEQSGWAIAPRAGSDHAAVLDFAEPLQHPGGAVFTLALVFKGNDGHGLGRLRIAASDESAADPAAVSIPEPLVAVLAAPPDQRSGDQRRELLDWYRTREAEWQALNRVEEEHLAQAPQPQLVKALVTGEGLPPLRLHSQGEDYFSESYYLRRGDPNQKDGLAAPGFLQVLMRGGANSRDWLRDPSEGSKSSLRRQGLAAWLTDVDRGAGNLLARVIVNRLWQHHFGSGLVATPSDFGTRGEPPSHPELLEWLALELIRQQWRLKPLHKLMVTSAVYQQSAQADEQRLSADRPNRWWWRYPVRRLEAEAIRDALLSVSGRLDETMYGPGTLDASSTRRSIYLTVKRSKLVPMLQVFDAPDALQGLGVRATTTIAPQALLLMNNPQVREAAAGFARRLQAARPDDLAGQLALAHQWAFARQPQADELTDAEDFVRRQSASYSGHPPGVAAERALVDFCQVLLCANEFVYLE